jgi:hypothetical protein
MPQLTPHSLSDHAYTDIVAFILQANGFPYATSELEQDLGALNKIAIAQMPGGD